MVEFKLVVSTPVDGKSKTITASEAQAQSLIGMRVGDMLSGEQFGFSGQELIITGGSDKSGVPLRSDVAGGGKRKILLSGPPGYHPKSEGQRKRKLLRGNMITEDIVQINLKVKQPEEADKKGE